MGYFVITPKKPMHIPGWCRKYGPDILTYSGIATMIGGTIAACVATRKEAAMEEEIQKEPNKARRVWKRVRPYAGAATLTIAGSLMIGGSHEWMKANNAKLLSEVGAITAGLVAYRKRWQNKVGKEEEEKVFNGETEVEMQKVDNEGNVTTEKVSVTHVDTSVSYSRYFDRWSSWRADEDGNQDYDEQLIRAVQSQLNDLLWGDPRQMVLLNTAYEYLALKTKNQKGQYIEDRSVIGQVAGWILDKKNPGTRDNRIILTTKRTTRQLEDGTIVPTILVDFNVDGNIMREAQEKGILK